MHRLNHRLPRHRSMTPVGSPHDTFTTMKGGRDGQGTPRTQPVRTPRPGRTGGMTRTAPSSMNPEDLRGGRAPDGRQDHRRLSADDDLRDASKAVRLLEPVIYHYGEEKQHGPITEKEMIALEPGKHPEHLRIWQHWQAATRAGMAWRDDMQARESGERERRDHTCPVCGQYRYVPVHNALERLRVGDRSVGDRDLPGGGKVRSCGDCFTVMLAAVSGILAADKQVAGGLTRLQVAEAAVRDAQSGLTRLPATGCCTPGSSRTANRSADRCPASTAAAFAVPVACPASRPAEAATALPRSRPHPSTRPVGRRIRAARRPVRVIPDRRRPSRRRPARRRSATPLSTPSPSATAAGPPAAGSSARSSPRPT